MSLLPLLSGEIQTSLEELGAPMPIVDENGKAQNLKVVRSLGLGLDQKAIEAVEKWRFKPGMKDGKSVPVIATIEVNFRLL